MASVTFDVRTDMRNFGSYSFPAIESGGGGGNSSSTAYEWTWSSGFHEVISGTGFDTSNFTFFPDDGTVTGWEMDYTEHLFNPDDPFTPIDVNHHYWTFSGLSVPGADFSNAISSDGATLAAYMPTLFSGNDTIAGSAFDDYLLGFEGGDTMNGNAGKDGLEGGGGNDTLNGGPGADIMIGGTGDDTYTVDNISDKVTENAGEGTDTVKSSVTLTLAKNVENLTLIGSSAIDGTGNALENTIAGNDAANVLVGGGGHDVLKGNGGDDTLNGGTENDTLTGGSGHDQFLFSKSPNSVTNVDTIKDFSVADDTIGLSRGAFSALTTPGTLAPASFYTGSAAHDPDDRIIYDSTNGNLYYDPDGNGMASQILFAHLTAGLAMTNNDFLVI